MAATRFGSFAPGTPFAADLQSWIRNDGPGALAPDWERIGTDVTHQGPFNAAFSLSGDTVPEPSSLLLLGNGLAALVGWRRRWVGNLESGVSKAGAAFEDPPTDDVCIADPMKTYRANNLEIVADMATMIRNHPNTYAGEKPWEPKLAAGPSHDLIGTYRPARNA
jgi:hypothetical protein